MAERMRAFEYQGRRRGVRLDEATWSAVDWLAEQRGMKWPELAREWATLGMHGPVKDDNLTRVIRASAMQALIAQTIFAERAELHAAAGPIWKTVSTCGDRDFREALEQAAIEAHEDFGGFTLHVGISEFGNVTVYVENHVKDGSNAIISTPFPLDEWEAKRAERMDA